MEAWEFLGESPSGLALHADVDVPSAAGAHRDGDQRQAEEGSEQVLGAVDDMHALRSLLEHRLEELIERRHLDADDLERTGVEEAANQR